MQLAMSCEVLKPPDILKFLFMAQEVSPKLFTPACYLLPCSLSKIESYPPGILSSNKQFLL